MSNALVQRLNERRERRRALEREIIVLEAEIRAYEEALRLVSGEAGSGDDGGQEGGSAPEGTHDRAGPVPRKPRNLSPHWARIIAVMAERRSSPTSIADIVGIAAANGLTLSKPTVRSQMSLYTARGITKRVGQGCFTVTEEALGRLGDSLPGSHE